MMYYVRNLIEAAAGSVVGGAVNLGYRQIMAQALAHHQSNIVQIPAVKVAANALSAIAAIATDGGVTYYFNDPRLKFLFALGCGIVGTGAGVGTELLAHNLLVEHLGGFGAAVVIAEVPAAATELTAFISKFFKVSKVQPTDAEELIAGAEYDNEDPENPLLGGDRAAKKSRCC